MKKMDESRQRTAQKTGKEQKKEQALRQEIKSAKQAGQEFADTGRKEEEAYLQETLQVIKTNIANYETEVSQMQEQIDEMLDHYHDNDVEIYTALSNTVTMRDNMKHALLKNQKAIKKPYFGRIIFRDETLEKEESLYIGRGGISKDTTHQMVIDWRAPVANAYYENGLGKCSYLSPDGKELPIDLKLKRTYEIEDGTLLEYFDTEVIANDDLLTKYLAKNKQAVLGEIIATIQKEQNDIIRKSPYHNMIVQGVAGSGKTTVAMHRISYILYNYQERFKPDDFYIVGSNRILLEYITGVLPDLDVYGIRQMTMEQLFTRLLYEDWDEKKYKIISGSQDSPDDRIRGTITWFEELKKYCRLIEKEAIDTATVYLNPKQFVEGLRGGVSGVYDETEGKEANPKDLIEILSGADIEDYVREMTKMSVQSKINMLNERLLVKVKDEFLRGRTRYTEKERKAIIKAYRGRFGKNVWKRSIFDMYREFLLDQREKGYRVRMPDKEFDVYDLAALAFIYKRIKETEVISEAHHVVIDEAQDYGMMAYAVLDYCMKDCTYTVMGDVSQNIHFGYGLNDWEELKRLLLNTDRSEFGVLKKSYRNTVEISNFAMNILRHGKFAAYPAEPIIRHGKNVEVKQAAFGARLWTEAAKVCRDWQEKGLNTIAVVCRTEEAASQAAKKLNEHIPVTESSLEKAVFSDGVMVLPVAYTKGLEFDAVLILDPDREDYPVDDGHAKLLYVAATRALHELCILHTGNLTGLIADPIPEKVQKVEADSVQEPVQGVEAERTQKQVQRAEADEMWKQEQKAEAGSVRNQMQRTDTVASLENSEEGALSKVKISASEKPTLQMPGKQAVNVVTAYKKPSATLRKPKAVAEPPKTMLLTGVKPIVPGRTRQEREEAKLRQSISGLGAGSITGMNFGDMPTNEFLRPAGHAKIDLSVKWVYRQRDGIYLQSRYGVLRLSPVKSDVIRVTFVREGLPEEAVHKKIALRSIEKIWMYKESSSTVDLLTEELCVQVDKQSGAITFMDRNKKVLLKERSSECRQIETAGAGRAWNFFDWKKETGLYTPGSGNKEGLKLKGSARYIQPDTSEKSLPTVISDKGYCIVAATDKPV
ncbi:MAG: AAA family ATPase, partial [Lachnospiraceae bacterium]|nr:AAA family ATPase [Lachnospiraceae bacterium]